ncbi:MAG: S9 family peptidase [Spirosomataceae bacterium]
MNVDAAKPPVAKVIPKDVGMHGDHRIDNYYWLNQREDPEVISYLKAENAYTEAVMKPTVALQDKLFNEMKARIKEDDASVPYKDGNYYYYSRYEKGGEYPIYCRKKGTLEAPEEILLNGNEMSKGKKYFNIGGYEVSDNEEIVAYGVDTVSRRNYTLQFKNLKTGEIFKDEIKNTEGGAYAWAADNKTVFYMVRDQQTLLASKVYRHELGTSPKKDVLVYEEKDNQFYTGVYRMKSKKYIAIQSSQNGVADEVLLLEASNPTGAFEVFLPRRKGHEYSVDHFENKFYVRTNKDAAENFKLVEVAEGQQHNESLWKDVIPHRKDVYLDGFDVFKNHLVLQERKEGLLNLRIISQQNHQEHYLDFGEPAYSAGIGYNPDFNTTILRYGYTSLTTPNSTFDYNMDTKEKKLMKEQEIPGGYDKTQYVTERLWAPARDGRKVPISIVYKKGFEKDGKAPLLQYAYGSYGASMDPYFSTSRLSLLNRGFAFALCHIRGGQEMGRYWYEEGKMFKKKNTFTDFIDCSEYLIKEKYTSIDGLFAMGGSAGGLLMGAVSNMAPQLYKGMVAQVAFVDVVTTMLDESIPLTTGEFEEWGNPKNKDSYEYMKSYSPYDNVEKKAYPNMLITTGLHDSQVQYWEPAKWVAKLRTMKTDKHLLLFKCDMDAGHGGASGRFKALKEVATEYAFMLNLAGIAE